MPRPRKIVAIDAETDPFLYGRVPKPFIWGLYDGRNFDTFETTGELVERLSKQRIIAYAHNGGKFDFMYMLPFLASSGREVIKTQIINGRIVALFIGLCELRDSYAIIPEPLKKFGAKKEIDYAKLEEPVRHLHMAEIKEYLYYDCRILFDAVSQYRAIAGTRTTIASNALSFARKLGIDPGQTNHTFDREMRNYYYGGRCECFLGGTHKDIKLLDIHSAYPGAMIQHHATGNEFITQSDFRDMTDEDIQRSFIKLECTSNGAFPKRVSGVDGHLSFPHEYDLYHVTGWEYLAARDLGLIENVSITTVKWTQNTITFKPYVEHWFEYKARHDKNTDPVNYTIGKIMMNSLYGKLAQNPARYFDYKIVEAGTEIDHENGWEWQTEYEGHEIHRRESLWKYKFEYGVEWKSKPLYKNVATGASITGYVRATLLRTMHQVGIENVIYCDTDGIVLKPTADTSKLEIGNLIGQWGIDDECAPIGHFSGKKLYAVHQSDGKKKIASKGSKLDFDQLVSIVNGETVNWKSDAPAFSIDGSTKFVQRNIRATAKNLVGVK
jgi:DNA polymerase type B, organellar and viral